MPKCLSVDPHDLVDRANRLRALGRSIGPTVGEAERLIDELAAIGAPACLAMGQRFGSSWALALASLAGTLDEVGTQLDGAAVTYAALETLIAEALD